ncbi:RNA polymerase sigma factor SigJ [Rhodococcoides fascians]|uniref:RNA polymerase sigma factor SigJ n=1 Tax=Rhodococcoides fascians TaxID=1828 RepID=UPI0005660427|nr:MULTISPECIES: RNA polymerase sigma factor SigJ [Rhodococcus]OZE96483.1 RNA polymerase sigma factor SigJ [Rhodococcus sp. 15-1189-1-1a]
MADKTESLPAHLGDVHDERRRLLSMAYRMTGTLSDAEDVVQETYLRWYRLNEEERAEIANPAAWLTRVGSRVALDLLGSARARRERYVGEWLPEPVPADLFAGTATEVDPADRVTLDDAVSTALLVVLEAMTPAERVAFVLHDVFAVPFDEIAGIVGRSPAATRQLASAARRHVREQRSTLVAESDHDATVRSFLAASRGGDIGELMEVLAPDVTLRSDGGGFVSAARRPVLGSDRVARFVLGVVAKQPALRVEETRMADGLGYRLLADHRTIGTANFRVVDGRIVDVWFMLNPEKLTSWLPRNI